jgi:hypothetical protein
MPTLNSTRQSKFSAALFQASVGLYQLARAFVSASSRVHTSSTLPPHGSPPHWRAETSHAVATDGPPTGKRRSGATAGASSPAARVVAETATPATGDGISAVSSVAATTTARGSRRPSSTPAPSAAPARSLRARARG